MATPRLSPLDAGFLEIETPSAHMHVGWAALFDPPADGPAPTFEQLRDHIGRRLGRAPRYRQRLMHVPLGVARPVWVDDDRFELDNHVRHARGTQLHEQVDAAMSIPLPRERPLWEMSIADRLEDGRIAIIGKAHHCMVDGIAAVGLASLLVDPMPDPPPDEPGRWLPAPAPDRNRLLIDGIADRLLEPLGLIATTATAATAPGQIRELAVAGVRAVRALAHSATPATPIRSVNEPLSPRRHLAMHARPLEELRALTRAAGVTINDAVLAATAGAMRRLLQRRGLPTTRLKAMMPVNVRGQDDVCELGNRIAFLFVDLPCDEPDPVERLRAVHSITSARKQAGEPEGAETILRLLAHAPIALQRAASHLAASPRTFNLAISNIPGPSEPLFMAGCRLREVFPAVPLADGHTVSIAFVTVAGRACFGVYADSDALPEADLLAEYIGVELDELMERAVAGNGSVAGAERRSASVARTPRSDLVSGAE